MADKRETRKDLPKREFDSDLNSPALSNYDDAPVNQRDSDGVRDHAGNREDVSQTNDNADSKVGSKTHDEGNAENLSR